MIVFPNAKINLGLNIVEKRPDGYHNIETIFLPIELNDALEVYPKKDINTPYSWTNSGLIIDTPAEENICIKALNALIELGCKIPPTEIHLYKNVPFGAGLGGGSSDAAHMLTLLNDYYELGFGNDKLKDIALQLGADCPFFIDNSPCFASGIGEQLTPINIDLSGYTIALVVPNIHVSTPTAYSNVTPSIPKIKLTDAIKHPIEEWRSIITNDFEKSVFPIYPAIEKIKQQMYDKGALYASMSGSGSSVFGIFEKAPTLNTKDCFNWQGGIKKERR